MDEFIVNNQEELCAAVLAVGSRPAEIRLGTCTYRFREGLTDEKAQAVVNNIRAVSAAYFDVTEARV